MDISGTTLEGLGLVRFIPGSGSAAQNPIRICVKNAAGVPVPVKLHLVVIHIGRVGGVVGGAGDGMEDEDPGHVVSVSMVGPGVLDVIYSVTDATAASVGISIKIKGLPVTPAPVIVPILLGYLGGGTFVKSYAIGAMQPHTGLAVSYDEKIMVVACAPRAAASIASIGMHVYSLPEGRRVSQIDLPLGYKPLKCCFAWQSNTNLLVIDSDLGRMLEYNVKGEQVRDFLDGGSRDMNCMAVAGDMVAIGRKVKSGKQVTIMSYASGATIAAWTTGLNRIPDAAQIDALAFTPDQTHIVCVDNQARAYICTVAGVFIKCVRRGCGVCACMTV